MLLSNAHIAQQVVLIVTVALASVLGFGYLRWRGHLASLRAVRVPLLGFAVFGICDALVTLHGTWQAPWREGNPSMRAFLLWAGWWGQCLGSGLWIMGWALVLDGLETLRARRSGRTATLIGGLRLWTVYALALGHLNGFLSWAAPASSIGTLFSQFYRLWTRNAGWLAPLSPFGYPLYSGLFFGGVCTLLHVLVARTHKRLKTGTLVVG